MCMKSGTKTRIIKRFLLITMVLINCSLMSAQSIEDLSFGTDTTFEVATWNIEWFPKNGQITLNYLIELIEALDIDLLAIQEVDDTIIFAQLMDSLNSYEGYLESSYFAGLAYIYKPDIIQVNDIYEIYTTSPYWSPFPRSPMVMDFTFMNERIITINNHFKCCGDGILDLDNSNDEETRRYYASNLLKEYIDTYFPDENTIVLGDLNDVLSDDPDNNVFQQFLNDPENYLFTDFEIAAGDVTGWSYPTWPSHLDHILISNELFDEFEQEGSLIQTIKIDEYIMGGWEEYEENISDHRPVGIKLLMHSNVGINNLTRAAPYFMNYPNPFHSITTFSFEALNGKIAIEIINLNGQVVFFETIPEGEYSLTWNAEGLPDGIYLARLLMNNSEVARSKIVLIE